MDGSNFRLDARAKYSPAIFSFMVPQKFVHAYPIWNKARKGPPYGIFYPLRDDFCLLYYLKLLGLKIHTHGEDKAKEGDPIQNFDNKLKCG